MGFNRKWKRFFGAGEGRQGNPELMRHANEVQWDPNTGRPIGLSGPPDQSVALEYQWKSNEVVDQQRQARRRDALNFLRQGTAISESYRPGGAAAMNAGLYQGMANTSLHIADTTDYVDMMAGYRDYQAYEARKAQHRANVMRGAAGVVSAGLSLIGGDVAGAGDALQQGFDQGGGQNASVTAANEAVSAPPGQSGGGGTALSTMPSPVGGPEVAAATAAPITVPGTTPTAPGTMPRQSQQAGSVGGGGSAMSSVPVGGPGGGGGGGGSGGPGVPGGKGGGGPGQAHGGAQAQASGPMPAASMGPSPAQILGQMSHIEKTDDNFDAGVLDMVNSMLADVMVSFGGL